MTDVSMDKAIPGRRRVCSAAVESGIAEKGAVLRKGTVSGVDERRYIGSRFNSIVRAEKGRNTA